MTGTLKYIIFIILISIAVFFVLRFAEKFTFLGNLFGNKQAETVRTVDTPEFKQSQKTIDSLKLDNAFMKGEKKILQEQLHKDDSLLTLIQPRFITAIKKYREADTKGKQILFLPDFEQMKAEMEGERVK